MKEPKTFRWPRLYWQPLFSDDLSGRMRIIYPDGSPPEWAWASRLDDYAPNIWSNFFAAGTLKALLLRSSFAICAPMIKSMGSP